MIKEIDYGRLGIRVKELRLTKHITQETLAELVGCNTSHISNIENNYTKASLNVLLAIANALETSIDSLLSEQYDGSSDILMKELTEIIRPLDVEAKQKLLKIIDILFADKN